MLSKLQFEIQYKCYHYEPSRVHDDQQSKNNAITDHHCVLQIHNISETIDTAVEEVEIRAKISGQVGFVDDIKSQVSLVQQDAAVCTDTL